VLARHPRPADDEISFHAGDLVTGDGVQAAVAGAASWGYMNAKLQAERAITGSGLPWTILRATQFYDYILPLLRKLAKLPVIPIPAGFHVQPVATDEVAARLVQLTLGAPAGRVPDLAGPEVTSWAGLLADYPRASGRRRPVIPLLIPGTRAIRAGGLLPPPGHSTGNRTWGQFLAASQTATSVRLFGHLEDGRRLEISQLNRCGRDVLGDVIG
jgi:uncharacterized protein YbjT (DUF2867 family)